MRFIVALLALAIPLLACAEAKPVKPAFEEGEHYTVLSGQPAPAKTGKMTVTEFYWYGCGHCYKFEPLITAWKAKMPKDVEFVGSPAMWEQRRAPADAMWTHAKLYYTAKSMGALDKLHTAFFEAMHLKGKRLVDKAEIEALVNEHGVDGKVFVSTMDSFAIDAQVKLADSRQKNYRISGTPELVVADYYHIKSKGGQAQMLEVADFLLAKIRSER